MIRVALPNRIPSCHFPPPLRPLSSASAFHFGNLLCSFRSSRARSTKISHLFSTTCPLFFTLAKISPSFTHSSQKHPGGTPLPTHLLKLYLKFSTPSSLFTSHDSLVTIHQFPIWLLSAPLSTQTIDLQPLHAPRSNHGHRNHLTFPSRHRLAPGMARIRQRNLFECRRAESCPQSRHPRHSVRRRVEEIPAQYSRLRIL